MNASLPGLLSSTLSLVLCLAGAGPARALTPYLVKDINPEARPDGSSPREFATMGGMSVFTASGEEGAELWASDGTTAGTFLLADTCPGPCSGIPELHVPTGDGASFFRSGTASGRDSLWVTRGTPASTFRLTDDTTILARFSAALVGAWVAEQRLFYFTASDGAHGNELWRTDGTPAGTFQVADIRPGPEGSLPLWLTSFRGRVFFNADNGSSGPALWSSDGTVRGTRLVKDAHPGAAQTQGPSFLDVIGNRLVFFFVDIDLRVPPLWSSDGTARGTVPLPGLDAAGPQSLVAKNGRFLFFRGSDRQRGAELWATDGTAKGTRPVTRFSKTSPFVSEGQPQAILSNRYVFLADDGVRGAEPWVTDGTTAGTRLLRDICPGACSSNAFPRLAHGGRLFFEASNARGTELWLTDGTPAGTRLVKDICPGACSSSPRYLAAVGRHVLFGTTGGGHEDELWATDGTPAGTVLLARLASAFYEESSSGTIPGALLFAGDDEIRGSELWRTDGTPAGTALVADLAPFDLGGSMPCALEPVGDRILFFADDGLVGKELWISDGTGGGTRLLRDLFPGPAISGGSYCPVFDAVEAAGQILFQYAATPPPGPTLWRSDGTTEGTFALLGEELSDVGDLRSLGSFALFSGGHSSQGSGLWRTDGTAAGTRFVREIELREPFVFQGRLFFGARSPDEGVELWMSDGTTDGTKLVEDIAPGSLSSEPGGFTAFAGRLYFFARATSGGRSLWVTDGAAAGTHAVFEEPGFQSGVAVADGNRLFFFGRTGALGPALWVTDGTAAGTRLVAQLVEEPTGTAPTVYQGSVWFSVRGSLWKSDGTAEGTGLVRDSEGSPIVNPSHLRVFADRLFFLSTLGAETILFQSDGTEAGMHSVRVVGRTSRNASWYADLEPAGARLFFPALDPATGYELWALAPD